MFSLSSTVSNPNTPLKLTKPLRLILAIVLLLFSLLTINSAYLLLIRWAQLLLEKSLQGELYLLIFFAHLVLGALITIPVLIFGVLHFRKMRYQKNRYAKRAGIAMYLMIILLLFSGVLLIRFGFLEINDQLIRRILYWLHVLLPMVVAWLFILHRLAGASIHWRLGAYWSVFAILSSAVLLVALLKSSSNAKSGADLAFNPAFAKVSGGKWLKSEQLMLDDYCAECHQDIAEQAKTSMHKLSSFNNPVYRLSIDELREDLLKRDGDVQQARLCAVCHDQALLFDGAFDQKVFEPDSNNASKAGITCLGCHAIGAVNGLRGNGEYQFTLPVHYPFTFSQNAFLRGINHMLIRAKPEVHKASLLNASHSSAEFCSVCHKVFLPESLNQYRWLRGQNHYDSFIQSGISGHRVDSFYYPDKAISSCVTCHMPDTASEDPAAKDRQNGKYVHHHGFRAANAGVPYLMNLDKSEIEDRRAFLKDVARVDLFAIFPISDKSDALWASTPLRPEFPVLMPGETYRLELVVRNLKVGHHLTQGTTDSNELWLQVDVHDQYGQKLLQNGGLDSDGRVDPWAYFVNSYVLDEQGEYIDRRNVHDVRVALYDHQIPPGAASVVHYELTLPKEISGAITISAKLNYRKFNSALLRHLEKTAFEGNDLPIIVLAEDLVTIPVLSPNIKVFQDVAKMVPQWERWNDYGIGLLRSGSSAGANKGELRGAEQAFKQVESLGKADGPVNLARVYFKEGRLEEAQKALDRANKMAGRPWTIAWLSALVDRQFGRLGVAADKLDGILVTKYPAAKARGMDFSKDLNVINQLAQVRWEQSRRIKRKGENESRSRFLGMAENLFERVLKIDPENTIAHYGLSQVYQAQNQPQKAEFHRREHERYRVDDQVIERVISKHRRMNPAADHAAEPGAVYTLSRLQ